MGKKTYRSEESIFPLCSLDQTLGWSVYKER